MTGHQKTLLKLITSAILFAIGLCFANVTKLDNYVSDPQLVSTAMLLTAYVLVGFEVIFYAFKNILHGHIFDENFLMTFASMGAIALGQYSEATAVMLFYQIGETFQDFAVRRTRSSIAELMNIRPDIAHLQQNNDIIDILPQKVQINDIILVKTGEHIPLDGVVISGNSSLNTSSLTGEVLPFEVGAGDEVLSGTVNLGGLLKIRVTKAYNDSAVAKILELVENASSHKAKVEKFITRFAKVYTPFVVISALLVATLPPIFLSTATFSDWGYRALVFLVISCPCALVISIPLSLFCGVGAASRNGILIKGSNYLQLLAQAKTLVFDKTGTVTHGKFEVVAINPQAVTETELLYFGAYACAHSNHPLSVSTVEAYNQDFDFNMITDFAELPAQGVKAVVSGRQIAVGNLRLMHNIGVDTSLAISDAFTRLHIAADGVYIGSIAFADKLKKDMVQTIKDLYRVGINKIIMLTGDIKANAQKVGNQLQLDEVKSELLPADKVKEIEKLLADAPANGKVIFVGDGINDAPVLMRADIGIAMGQIGSDAAIEAADVVLMNDDPQNLLTALKLSKRTMRVVYQNIIFALGCKFGFLALGAMGIATMWEAVFADVGVLCMVVLNAMRCYSNKK